MSRPSDRERRAVDAESGPPDSREATAPDAQHWSGIIRCEYCGREVREDWTPEQSPETRLCARCLEMVRDPDTKRDW